MGGDSGISILVVLLVIIMAVFLAIRGFWCWYWKINRIVSLLESQNMLLLKLVTSGDTGVVELNPPLSEGKRGGLFSFFSKKGGV
jgi:hypothetical protein